MKISFIVTSYNYADYIVETIESIKNQIADKQNNENGDTLWIFTTR